MKKLAYKTGYVIGNVYARMTDSKLIIGITIGYIVGVTATVIAKSV